MQYPMISKVPDELPPRDAYRLMLSVVAPRPIAWVSTIGADGTLNLAPFSFFNGVSAQPPVVSVAIGPRRGGGDKDTIANVRSTGELVVNVVSEAMAEAMVKTSGDYEADVDEFDLAGFAKVPSDAVKPFRVKESPLAFECGVLQIVRVGEPATSLILAEVLVVHAADEILTDGLPDAQKFRPLARLGGIAYARLGDRIEIPRPVVAKAGE